MEIGSHSDNRYTTEEIEQRRVLFEQAWGQMSAPSIEQLLNEVPDAERPELLRELLYVEFELTLRQSVKLPIEQYLARFPGSESIVREVADAVSQYTVFKRRNIAGFTLLGEIGRGGMGVVYKAKNDRLKNLVAFKMVNQQMINNPEALSRFEREMEMIGRLKHPNIVEAKHAGVTPDGSPFLVMELVEGETLNQWNQKNLPKTQRTERQLETSRVNRICAIIRDTALGLQAIHEAGLVHRDIKPGNIMLLPTGQVKILDLGLAKLREQISEKALKYETQTRQGHVLGTPGFTAPEQTQSASHVDIRADIYSLGCTFFFLLYGRAPAENQTEELSVSLPKKLRTILDRMLAADPAARFQEPKEIVAALDSFLGSPRKSRWIGIAASVVIIVFLGMIAALFSVPSKENNDPPPPNSTQKPPITLEDVHAAIELRYRGNNEQASAILRTLENDLRANPFVESDGLLAEVLSAQGDTLFYDGLASDSLPEKIVKRLTAWYEEALTLSVSDVLRTKLFCKLAIVESIRKTGMSDDQATEKIESVQHALRESEDKTLLLYLRLAEAITVADDRLLRNFVEQFELSTEPELMTREALDLRLFALERLINRSKRINRETLANDVRSLDHILLSPYPDADSCVYLNRFFDLAIRVCEPTDYSQLVRYLCRLRPQGAVGARLSFPPGASLVLFYFSPWSDENGFAIYYPAERQNSQRFELPFNRNAVKEAIRRGESLILDDRLVSLIQQDINAGVPIILSWDDTACWSLKRDALSNEDWVFDESITIEDILGQLK